LLVQDLWTIVRRDISHFASHLDPPAAVVQGESLLMLTGGPTADFNVDLLSAGENAESHLRDLFARVHSAAVPAVFMLPNAMAARFWLASRDGEPYSTVTTVQSDHAAVGIWSMATAPARQRQGAGRAVLESVLERHRADGTSCFYLIATPAGEPLYDAIGFTTIDDLCVYVAGESHQFAAH
jgi:GNAT superfamily N-acetyltransferase